MKRHLRVILLAFTATKVISEEPDLPPCPANVQFFPQNLPMHCKMQKPPDQPENPGMMPFPFPPGLPGMPSFPGFPNPGIPGPEIKGGQGMPPPGLPGMPPPGAPAFPGPGLPGPMPMPMPVAGPGPAHKLPVIVMPFYSPDPTFKKPQAGQRKSKHRRPEIHTRRPSFYRDDISSDTDSDIFSDTSDEMSSDEHGWWKRTRGSRRSGRARKPVKKHKGKHKHSTKNMLTPILQYVTKDGYVIFEKEISKNEAKSWLSMKKENANENDHQVLDNPGDIPNDNNIHTPEADVNADVEILEQKRDKEEVEVRTHRIPAKNKKHYPHKLKPIKIHAPKEQEKDEASE